MEFLDLANRHFGQVHFIWTHRNILESLPSFISMVAHSQTIFSDQVSLDRVARHWVKKTGLYAFKRVLNSEKLIPVQKFTDVFYKDIVASPMSVLGELYRNGLSISPELYQKFLDTDRQNAPNRYGTHVYSLEDFDLNSDELNKTVEHLHRFS